MLVGATRAGTFEYTASVVQDGPIRQVSYTIGAEHIERGASLEELSKCHWRFEYKAGGALKTDREVLFGARVEDDCLVITWHISVAVEHVGIHVIHFTADCSPGLRLEDEFVFGRAEQLDSLCEWHEDPADASAALAGIQGAEQLVACRIASYGGPPQTCPYVVQVHVPDGAELVATGVVLLDHTGCRRYYYLSTDPSRRPLVFKYVWVFARGDNSARLLDLASFVAPAANDERTGATPRNECTACSGGSDLAPLLALHDCLWHTECHTSHCWRCHNAAHMPHSSQLNGAHPMSTPRLRRVGAPAVQRKQTRSEDSKHEPTAKRSRAEPPSQANASPVPQHWSGELPSYSGTPDSRYHSDSILGDASPSSSCINSNVTPPFLDLGFDQLHN